MPLLCVLRVFCVQVHYSPVGSKPSSVSESSALPDDVLPTLKLWQQDLRELQALRHFKMVCCNELGQRPGLPSGEGAKLDFSLQAMGSMLRELVQFELAVLR